MNTRSPALLLVGLVAALSVGCAATPPTVGDRMISQSKDTRELGKQWKRGDDMVVRGEKIKAEGQETIKQGEQRVQEGERIISEGNTLKKESELLFKERFPGQELELYKN